MKRIIAELTVDEQILLGHTDNSFGDCFNEEFGWLEESGITLCNWRFVEEHERIKEE